MYPARADCEGTVLVRLIDNLCTDELSARPRTCVVVIKTHVVATAINTAPCGLHPARVTPFNGA